MKVNLLVLLRAALYLTFSLGIGRLLNILPGRGLWEAHLLLGIVIAVLAVFALRPRAGLPRDGLRLTARFFPLLPLAIGLALWLDWLTGPAPTLVHVALGIATIGLIEAVAARERRSISTPA
ncbi:MAG TPA: hypothetical protein VHL09_16400 [Dehalococcoidia bacterium]|nr:hypothetical protein [Dehalococcoidia bacterium]